MRSIRDLAHLFLLVAFVCLQVAVSCTCAEDSGSVADSPVVGQGTGSASSDAGASGSPADSDGAIKKRKAFIQATEEAIQVFRNHGDANRIADWQELRAEYAATETDECAATIAAEFIGIVRGLRERNELREAERLMPLMISLAMSLKSDKPQLHFAAEREASVLEVGFERYESAFKHAMIAMRIVSQEYATRRYLISSLGNYAHVLERLKRLDEAEGIYISIQDDIKQNPEGITRDATLDARFALAALYAEKGEFEKYRKTVPGKQEDLYDDDGEFVSWRAVSMARAYINYNTSPDGKLARAADKGQRHCDWTREYFGVASREHIEALELLSKVRVAEKKYEEAERLLKESAKFRSTLLGNEHPSIASTYKDVDAVRKQMLDDAEQEIWPQAAERAVAERYGLKAE